jgi:hypothetical protein
VVITGGSRISSKGGGAHLKNLHRAKGGVKIVGVFRVKNPDFTITHFTDLVEALLIPLTHIYMTTHFTDLVEALLIPLTHIYMTTHFTDLVEALLIPLTHIYMTTHITYMCVRGINSASTRPVM